MVRNGKGGNALRTNSSDRVHCNACGVEDPYGISTWTPAEARTGRNYQDFCGGWDMHRRGSGPTYQNM
jgi:hypothetical protein